LERKIFLGGEKEKIEKGKKENRKKKIKEFQKNSQGESEW